MKPIHFPAWKKFSEGSIKAARLLRPAWRRSWRSQPEIPGRSLSPRRKRLPAPAASELSVPPPPSSLLLSNRSFVWPSKASPTKALFWLGSVCARGFLNTQRLCLLCVLNANAVQQTENGVFDLCFGYFGGGVIVVSKPKIVEIVSGFMVVFS